MTRRKILVVAMADSVHTARWLESMSLEDSNVILFGSGPHRRVHPTTAELIARQPERIQMCGPRQGLSVLVWFLDVTLRLGLRRRWLLRVIQRTQPDVIHAMETQHAGYLVTDALSAVRTDVPVTLSLWGSDIYWFSRFASHRRRIASVLERTGLLIAECQRDLDLARQLGYAGRDIRLLALTGGISERELVCSSGLSPSHFRYGICIKGYSGFVGQAPVALRAAVAAVKGNTEWHITVYAASLRTWMIGTWLRWRHRVKIDIHRKGRLSDDQLRDIFARSRISVMLSRSDGFPATLKQSLLFGVVPVMAATSCAGELLGGEGLEIVDEIEVRSVQASICRLMTAGAELERRVEQSRAALITAFDQAEVRRRVNAAYEGVGETP